jgi:signal transduction histidine kinase
MFEAHAALGRLVQLVIHEGRKPLQFIGANFNNLEKDIQYFIKHPDNSEVKNDLMSFIEENKSHIETISKLFAGLDPLTAKRLSRKKEFDICKNIHKNSDFFKDQLFANKISLKIECKETLYYGREEDFFIIYTNLIENSIYWLNTVEQDNKSILIQLYEKDSHIIIDYKDNGPGIDEKFANEIFDAGFSQKPEGGTGIGLTLAGQAVSRNNGQIECIKNDSGAFFRITLMGDSNE